MYNDYNPKYDDWEDICVYTHEELKELEDSIFIDNETFPSFEQYVLSLTKTYDIIEIDYNKYVYKVIGNTLRNKKLERILKK